MTHKIATRTRTRIKSSMAVRVVIATLFAVVGALIVYSFGLIPVVPIKQSISQPIAKIDSSALVRPGCEERCTSARAACGDAPRCADDYLTCHLACQPCRLNSDCTTMGQCLSGRCSRLLGRSGCAYSKPSCNSGYRCAANVCIPSICHSDSDCDPENPGIYRCRDSGRTCERRAFDCEGRCTSDEMCVQDRCVSLNQILIDDPASDRYCAHNQVYRDGVCRPASLELIFFTNSQILKPSVFDQYVKQDVTALIAVSPLGKCEVNRIRVHKIPDFCSASDTRIYLESHYLGYTLAIGYYNSALRSECRMTSGSGDRIILMFDTMDSAAAATLHELGHTFGLWDQYCFLPISGNPNPIQFDQAYCRPAGTDWLFDYCSRNPLTNEQFTSNPIECAGDLNGIGGRSMMGPGGKEIGAPSFGYSPQEYDSIVRQLRCH